MSSVVDSLYKKDMESEVLFETVLDEDPMTEAFLNKCIEEEEEKKTVFNTPMEG